MRLDVCFIGIGSIAKRHISNLKYVCDNRGIELHIDAIRRTYNAEEAKKLELEYVYTEYTQLNKVYDVIFITNPTELHLSTLEVVSKYGKHFFIEKPVVSINQVEKLNRLVLKQDAVYYVACPLRYNAVIQYIKEKIDPMTVISVRSISSSYPPDWRPGIDYRNTYSASKDMGGGVSIDLIHEWDYLTFLFGNPEKIFSFIGKKSSLEIDSEDYAVYIAEYRDKVVELHLDYFGRETIREVMLFLDNETIIGDIAHNKISFLKSGKTIDFQEERNHFQRRELEHFLDIIFGKVNNDSDIGHAVQVLKLTQGEI